MVVFRRLLAPRAAALVAGLALALPAAGLSACDGDDGSEPTADAVDDVPSDDAPTGDASGPDAGDAVAADTDAPPPEYTQPGWFPAQGDDADDVVVLDGLDGPVRVIVDGRGYPHIYAASEHDLAFAQGYVTARFRLFQMHTLRTAAQGGLGEVLGPGSLVGDVLLRLHGVARDAALSAEKIAAERPEFYAILEAYAAGVNLQIDHVNAIPPFGPGKPPEASIFDIQFQPWTPADSLAVGRLQAWDLAFTGQFDETDLLATLKGLQDAFDGTPLEGVEGDYVNFTPFVEASTIPETPVDGPNYDLAEAIEAPLYAGLKTAHVMRLRNLTRDALAVPHRRLSQGLSFGSNNWVVAGQHTASGRPILANDTHLALRNPAIFLNVHLNTTEAGGDIDCSGRQFPAAPGVILGHNQTSAWGATVFYSDVNDLYVERLTEDGTAVFFEGGTVDLVTRGETFLFPRPSAGCEAAAWSWLEGLDPVFSETDDGRCQLDITIKEVPHHGPIVPWSYDLDAEGSPVAFSWRWTGFGARNDVQFAWDVMTVDSLESFQSALQNSFDVGAQNWIYGDVNGDIALWPWHLVPVRSHLAALGADDSVTYPPFLPLPGDGSAEWDGWLEPEQIPHQVNPERGWIVTANADPAGIQFDNDPFDNGPYVGFAWAPGLRLIRSQQLVAQHADTGGITMQDMADVQGDKRSNLGALLVPHLLEALGAADSGADAGAAARFDASAAMQEAYTRLQAWDFESAAGVDPDGVWADDGSEEAESSIAASIFNAYVVFLLDAAIGDEGLRGTLDSRTDIRLVLQMLRDPEGLKTFDAEAGDALLWDDVTTDGSVETRAEIQVRALADALAFLSDPDVVGVDQAGGFGTDDMAQWRWGLLHTVKLVHNVASTNDIPPSNVLPDGFPRGGEPFAVDVASHRNDDTDFTYSSGAAMRGVYELTDPVASINVIPGGQDELPRTPHYEDEMALWVRNEAPPVPFTVPDVLAAEESTWDLLPAGEATR